MNTEPRTYETHGAFFGDPEVKALHISQAEHHAAADMLMSGTYGDVEGDQFRGCSVGCFAHDIDPNSAYYHEIVAAARGLPEWLVRWQDTVFEGLPADQRSGFHVDLAHAIPAGVDLMPALHAAAVARMDRILQTDHGEEVNAAVRRVRDLHAAREKDPAAWLAARSAAGAAAESAAGSAAGSAGSAGWSAWSAGWSAWSARSAEYITERDVMLAALRSLGGAA